MQIGAQLYTLREFTKTPQDIAETFRKVRDLDFSLIQISGMGEIAPQRLKEIVDETGLSVCVTHTSYERMLHDLDVLAQEHLLIGCHSMGIGAMPRKTWDTSPSRDDYLVFADSLNHIGRTLQERYGMTVAYHNHHFEFERFGDEAAMDLLIRETDPSCVEFILDTYWVQYGGASVVDYIKKLRGRMSVCHLKDMVIEQCKQRMCEVGNGNMNFPAILHALEETGVPYAVIEQDDCYGKNPFDCLKTSLCNLEKIL